MTPLPTRAEVASRPLFDAPTGSIHVRDLITLENRKKNRLSDHWVGVLVVAAAIGVITKTEGDIFETDFVRGLKIRKTRPNAGSAFLGPDGGYMEINQVYLRGAVPARGVVRSAVNLSNITTHPNFNAWKKQVVFAGLDQFGDFARIGNPRPFAIGNFAVGPTVPIPAHLWGFGIPSVNAGIVPVAASSAAPSLPTSSPSPSPCPFCSSTSGIPTVHRRNNDYVFESVEEESLFVT